MGLFFDDHFNFFKFFFAIIKDLLGSQFNPKIVIVQFPWLYNVGEYYIKVLFDQ